MFSKRYLELTSLLEVEVLLQQPPPLQRPLHHELEFVRIERLGQVVEGPELHGAHRGIDLGESGDHDDVEVRVRLLHPLQHFQAVHLGHHDVEDHDVIMTFVEFPQGLQPVLDGIHLIIAFAQNAKATPDDDLLVVNYQYPGAHASPPPLLPGASADERSRGR